MRVALVGGKLQGIEAAYLAKKAGFEVTLIDRRPEVPAAGLVDDFYQHDVLRLDAKVLNILGEADLVIPALEDEAALAVLSEITDEKGRPFAFDASSFSLSKSKNKSNELFTDLELPVPDKWPYCGFPVICKPSFSSGSRGVKKITEAGDMDVFFNEIRGKENGWVIQEYLKGPSYSLEVIGWNGSFKCIQATKIGVDSNHDCKRVTAPSGLPPGLIEEFNKISIKIAGAINLRGIMDLEVIHSKKDLKLLEIDARLPSQTPSVVYHSTGMNMIKILCELFCENVMPEVPDVNKQKSVIFEHVRAVSGRLELCGEHIMSEAGVLKCCDNFFGADEAITDFQPDRAAWAATIIIKGSSPEEVCCKHSSVIRNIESLLKLTISEELLQDLIF